MLLGDLHGQVHILQSKCETFKRVLCGSMRTQEVPLVNIKMKAWQEAGDLEWEGKWSPESE